MVARSAKSRTDKTETPSTAAAVTDEAVVLPQAEGAAEVEPVLVPEPALEPDRLPQPEPLQQRSPDPEPTIQQTVPVPPNVQPKVPPKLPPNVQSNVPPKLTVQKVGFAPVVFGGIVAAMLGYAAAYYLLRGQSADLTALIAAQTDRIAGLEAQVAALPAPADLSPMNAALSDLRAGLSGAQAETATALATLEGRLSELEKAPNADGTLSNTAIAAWEAELQTLRAEIGTEQDRMQQLVDAARSQLDQTRVEAATIEQTATDASAAALARAALARVQAALDSGTPFEAALGDLAATVAVPDVLTAAATEGVPTMLTLQADFPGAARAALGLARSEGLAGEEGGGIAGFLRNQFDVRSVTPQEGTTVDAILSRAEDDLRQNHLSDALAEVATLPEVVRAEMADWTGAAETRIAALAAVEGLSEILTQN